MLPFLCCFLLAACASLPTSAPSATATLPTPSPSALLQPTPAAATPSPASERKPSSPATSPTAAATPKSGGATGPLPAEAHITGLRGYDQTLPLSCEARSAADWASFFGFTIHELDFQERLPRSDDPDYGFVGDVMGVWGNIPPRSYGVHAGPVAELLREYGLPATARRGMTFDELKAEIAAGRPVITWVVGHVNAGAPQIYTSRAGRQVTVSAREHTVIVVGYTPEVVFIQDGGWLYGRAIKHFEDSWGVLGNMAIIYRQEQRD
ncbi:MAG: hypothetical protein HPY59_13310 [Anaerolineae bacterium]|nr:hypothetical protein [Anaerolineae bacterium]